MMGGRLVAAAATLLLLMHLAPAAARLLIEVDPHGNDTTPVTPPSCALNRTEYDVVVVGGGIAGLTAARDLLRQGKSVVVLEAQTTLGGRSERTHVTLSDGSEVPCTLPQCIKPDGSVNGKWWWDIGGQWVGPTHDRFLAMAAEYKVETYQAPQEVGMQRLFLDGKPVDLPQTILDCDEELTAAMKKDMTPAQISAVEEYQRVSIALYNLVVDPMIPYLLEPWKFPKAAELDAITFKSWVEQQTKDQGARDLLIWTFPLAELGGVAAGAVSMLETGRVLATMVEGGSEDKLFWGAAGQFVEHLAEEITAKGGRLVTSSPARHINQDATGVEVYADTGVFAGKYAIVAMPPWLTGRITYSPAMPQRRVQLTQRAPMGTTVKMVAFYAEPFWRNGKSVKDSISLAIDPNPALKVSEAFDVSPPGGPGALAGFLYTEHALEVTEAGPAAVEAAALDAWARYMQDERIKTDALKFVYVDWNAEQWTGGGYNGVLAPGAWTTVGPSFYKPVDRIHWAGTEYATKWMGFYEGAIRTGESAAQTVGGLLKE